MAGNQDNLKSFSCGNIYTHTRKNLPKGKALGKIFSFKTERKDEKEGEEGNKTG